MTAVITAAVLIIGVWLPVNAAAFECTVCHSKKPGMVKMHTAVRGRGCFDCHRIGEKLMGKGAPTDTPSLVKRRLSDPLCVECHKK